MKFLDIATSHLSLLFFKGLLAYYIEMKSYLLQEDRNQAVVSELDVHLAKGSLQMAKISPSWSCKLSLTSDGKVSTDVREFTELRGRHWVEEIN